MKRIYNHIADVPDERDLSFVPQTKKLPASVDLRQLMPPVFDQGQLGSCTGNGIVALREYYMLASGEPLSNLSRLYLYYKEREMEGTIDQDAGAMIRDGLKVLQKVGCSLESDFPYDADKFANKPSLAADQSASHYKVASYHRVMWLKDLKSALANRQPVVFGFIVKDSFESQEVADTGIVPMPKENENPLGGHCVLAVGYDDSKQLVIVRNSWGVGWGDKGYCYMPYAMFDGPLVTDMWACKLNPPKLAAEVPFLSAIQHYADAGVIDNPPARWIEYHTKSVAGTLTQEDAKYVELLVQKLAARDISLTDL